MAVRAVRRAIQVAADEPELIFTGTPDVTSCLPPAGGRELRLFDVPVQCASEMAVPGAMPGRPRLLAHVGTTPLGPWIRRAFLGTAAVLIDGLQQ